MTDTESLYCQIRQARVSALPEEKVRQRLLNHMIQELGFPASLIAVEKSLRQLPHLSVTDRRLVPDRRADIICFAKGTVSGNDLYPLLLVECKAIKLSPRVINQVLGYNHFIRACFIAIANEDEIRIGWHDHLKGEYSFADYLPSYDQLCSSIK